MNVPHVAVPCGINPVTPFLSYTGHQDCTLVFVLNKDIFKEKYFVNDIGNITELFCNPYPY